MSFISTPHVKIGAVAACVPKRIVTTQSYELFNPQELKLFQMGTGVLERRFVDHGTCASDLCYMAAKKILDSDLVHPEEIDILIFVSQSPDYILPATSMVLHKRLGLGKHVVAMDLNLGCSGYVYGLSVLSSLLSNSDGKKGLLLCGDVSSPSLSYEDKSTYPLFGDAGSATLVVKDAQSKGMLFNQQTDGSGFESIIIPGGGTRNPINDHTFEKKLCENGNVRSERDLHLNGVEVFNFALREVKTNIEQLLDVANINLDEVDYLIMHQANKLMNESVRKKMKVSADKVPYSLGEFGNTSSASIPLTMVHTLQDKLLVNKKLVLSGFGVGFSWGSVVMEARDLKVLPLTEYGP
jgi:3-oxoacyl-[acyl-carrier-protein] synthase III